MTRNRPDYGVYSAYRVRLVATTSLWEGTCAIPYVTQSSDQLTRQLKSIRVFLFYAGPSIFHHTGLQIRTLHAVAFVVVGFLYTSRGEQEQQRVLIMCAAENLVRRRRTRQRSFVSEVSATTVVLRMLASTQGSVL